MQPNITVNIYVNMLSTMIHSYVYRGSYDIYNYNYSDEYKIQYMWHHQNMILWNFKM